MTREVRAWWAGKWFKGRWTVPQLIPLCPLVELPHRAMTCSTVANICEQRQSGSSWGDVDACSLYAQAPASLHRGGQFGNPWQVQKSSQKWAFNYRVQNFTVEIVGPCNRKWSMWGTERFAELWGVRVFGRPLVCLTFWQLEQLLLWLLSMVLSRLSGKTKYQL